MAQEQSCSRGGSLERGAFPDPRPTHPVGFGVAQLSGTIPSFLGGGLTH